MQPPITGSNPYRRSFGLSNPGLKDFDAIPPEVSCTHVIPLPNVTFYSTARCHPTYRVAWILSSATSITSTYFSKISGTEALPMIPLGWNPYLPSISAPIQTQTWADPCRQSAIGHLRISTMTAEPGRNEVSWPVVLKGAHLISPTPLLLWRRSLHCRRLLPSPAFL
jgi:hypothetical protein